MKALARGAWRSSANTRRVKLRLTVDSVGTLARWKSFVESCFQVPSANVCNHANTCNRSWVGLQSAQSLHFSGLVGCRCRTDEACARELCGILESIDRRGWCCWAAAQMNFRTASHVPGAPCRQSARSIPRNVSRGWPEPQCFSMLFQCILHASHVADVEGQTLFRVQLILKKFKWIWVLRQLANLWPLKPYWALCHWTAKPLAAWERLETIHWALRLNNQTSQTWTVQKGSGSQKAPN